MKRIDIPILQVQHDWHISFLEKDKFWVTCSLKDEKIHGEVFVPQDQNQKIRVNSSYFEVIKKDIVSLEMKCTRVNYHSQCRFIRSIGEFNKIHDLKTPIESIDISPSGELGVSGSSNGDLKIWETKTGKVERNLKGHVSDVNCCKFLPSGKVVMSGSSDFQIKIWRIHDGYCAVTLKGHRGGINSLSFIDRGRNFVSSGRDGKIILWDCASQSIISELYKTTKPMNEVTGLESSEFGSTSEEPSSPKEFNTSNKVIGACGDNGKMLVMDIRSRKRIIDRQMNNRDLNCCCFLNDDIVFGSEDGEVMIYDLRFHNLPKVKFGFGSYQIQKVFPFRKNSLILGLQDGEVLVLDFNEKRVKESLTGSDLDPIYDINIHENLVFTGCKDSVVRKYNVRP